MKTICANLWCKAAFEVSEDDLAFYDRISPVIAGKKHAIPPPLICADCRQQRRLAFRNERHLYKQTCNLCKSSIISIYSSDKGYTVYCPRCWWSDAWDALSYGRPFDFQRPFFPQFQELFRVVPKMAVLTIGLNMNSDYVHDVYMSKNCYLLFDGEQCQDSYYGEVFARIRNCCDFFYLKDSELCYDCVHCLHGYSLVGCRFCSNCSESFFLLDCRGCRHCIGCVNLVEKEYHIFNKPHTKEEYERFLSSSGVHTWTGYKSLQEQASKFSLLHPRRAVRGTMNEHVRGDNLSNCKDVFDCFDCDDMRDCRHCTNCPMGATDCFDLDAWGDRLNTAYDCAYAGADSRGLAGCWYVGNSASDILHSAYCLQGGANMLGCVGMRKKEFCILNTQYSKEEYETLALRIVEHMKKTAEWCQFFPTNLSAFAYNETVAQQYYPVTEKQALERGWRWKHDIDETPKAGKVIPAAKLPDSIDDIPDDILNWAITCEKTGKPFRIIKQELDFYKQLHLPVPRLHQDERHHQRITWRNPRKLWNRRCMKCSKGMQTSYAPDRPEKIYCEDCYLKEVY